MKIKELLSRDTLSISFEVFPPKTETVFESVKSACHPERSRNAAESKDLLSHK